MQELTFHLIEGRLAMWTQVCESVSWGIIKQLKGIDAFPRVLLERLLPALLHAVAACGRDADMRFSCLKVLNDLLALLLDLNSDGEAPAVNHAACTEPQCQGICHCSVSGHAANASHQYGCLSGNPSYTSLQVSLLSVVGAT